MSDEPTLCNNGKSPAYPHDHSGPDAFFAPCRADQKIYILNHTEVELHLYHYPKRRIDRDTKKDHVVIFRGQWALLEQAVGSGNTHIEVASVSSHPFKITYFRFDN